MTPPLLKDQYQLVRSDFDRHPVWVRVQDYDRDQPWFKDCTEQTYRPWDGRLPIEPRGPFTLIFVRASFRSSDGALYPGYFQPTTEDWDKPIQRRMRDGTYTPPRHWSQRRGGSPLSILALLTPIIFVGERAYDFHLRRDPERRRKQILDFYAAIGKRPKDVFPVEFSADPALYSGIVSGRLDGFYSFPLDRPFEIDTGAAYLDNA